MDKHVRKETHAAYALTMRIEGIPSIHDGLFIAKTANLTRWDASDGRRDRSVKAVAFVSPRDCRWNFGKHYKAPDGDSNLS